MDRIKSVEVAVSAILEEEVQRQHQLNIRCEHISWGKFVRLLKEIDESLDIQRKKLLYSAEEGGFESKEIEDERDFRRAIANVSELDKIRSNPIKDRLSAFRSRFESTRLDLGIIITSDTAQAVLSVAALAALQNEQAARILPSRNGQGTLLGDLSGHISLVDSNNFDIISTIPLVDRVINNAPDVDIWSAMFGLVAGTQPRAIAPPTAFEKAVFDTPLRSSSASQRGIKQTHDEIDQRILEELASRVYYNVGGFYERYFEEKSWTNNASDIYERSKAQYTEGRWSGWPEPSIQSLFFKWFMKFQDTILGGLRRRYHTSANKVLRGSEADRKLEIFLTPADAALSNGEHDWHNVLVIGEHKQNPDEDRSAKILVQLAGYTREVFGSQPERRFVPGFTICGSLIRL
ncbi:hypothetical protein BKA65DRAFT_485858 [Rhexocercosporidium sp. MPI-PUGE-AT-0058]|nr:hypothetical protein BKA65DRAFT_485858 [Rhexocercosporidium sp. MPI-PUGE-AT-0058]